MSKSMNKYHKRSGSGMLPGWVKVGAIAVGVGVGGWSPGGGSKAWAGKQYMVVVEKSSSGELSLVLRDADSGGVDEMKIRRDCNGKLKGFCPPSSRKIARFHEVCQDSVSFNIGSFSFVEQCGGVLAITGGSSEDSISVFGYPVKLIGVEADVLQLESCDWVKACRVNANVFVLTNCADVGLYKGRAELTILNNSSLSFGSGFTTGDMLNYGGTLLPCDQPEAGDNVGNKAKIACTNSAETFLELNGFKRSLCRELVPGTSSFCDGDKGLVPFNDSEHIHLEEMDGGNYLYRISKQGVCYGASLLYVCDGCGTRHKADTWLVLKDAGGKRMFTSMVHVGQGGYQLKVFPFSVKLGANAGLQIHLRSQCCPMIDIERDGKVCFFVK